MVGTTDGLVFGNSFANSFPCPKPRISRIYLRMRGFFYLKVKKMILRNYQNQVVDEVLNEIKVVRAVLLQAPCGSGKTVMAAEIIRRVLLEGWSVLFLAHRRELVHQCENKLCDFCIDHGTIMAKVKPSFLPDVQVASIQTLNARLEAGKIELPPANLIIFDECHHIVAKTYIDLIDQYPKAKIVGLTATPMRGDGLGVGRIEDF